MNRTRAQRKKAARLRELRRKAILEDMRSGRVLISMERVDKLRQLLKRYDRR